MIAASAVKEFFSEMLGSVCNREIDKVTFPLSLAHARMRKKIQAKVTATGERGDGSELLLLCHNR